MLHAAGGSSASATVQLGTAAVSVQLTCVHSIIICHHLADAALTWMGVHAARSRSQYCSDLFSCTGDYKNITAMSTTVGNNVATCCTLKTCADYGAGVCTDRLKIFDSSKATTPVSTASQAQATCCVQQV